MAVWPVRVVLLNVITMQIVMGCRLSVTDRRQIPREALAGKRWAGISFFDCRLLPIFFERRIIMMDFL